MEMRGTPRELWTWLARPGSDVHAMYLALKHIPSQLLSYQQAALFVLAGHYKKDGTVMLDIGTGHGHSAAVMAVASPRARVITLTPRQKEVEIAVHHLHPLKIVEVWQTTSASFLASYGGPELSVVFVDGDHKRVDRDAPWWRWVRPGGLMLFHDYSPGSRHVVNTVDRMAVQLGRRPDVLIVDSDAVGMAGFYKR